MNLKVPSNFNNYYIVKSGDTLYSIAKNNNLKVEELKRINNLTSDILAIGQKLNLSNNNSKILYEVKPGDTLYKIARLYNTTVDYLKQINNLENNILSIGQQLVIK